MSNSSFTNRSMDAARTNPVRTRCRPARLYVPATRCCNRHPGLHIQHLHSRHDAGEGAAFWRARDAGRFAGRPRSGPARRRSLRNPGVPAGALTSCAIAGKPHAASMAIMTSKLAVGVWRRHGRVMGETLPRNVRPQDIKTMAGDQWAQSSRDVIVRGKCGASCPGLITNRAQTPGCNAGNPAASIAIWPRNKARTATINRGK